MPDSPCGASRSIFSRKDRVPSGSSYGVRAPQPGTRRRAVLVTGVGQQRLDARQVADQAGRHAKVAVAGRHPGNVKVHRPQQDSVRADQSQRLSVDLREPRRR